MLNKNTYSADNHHLHHLIYLFFLKKKISYSNNLTGIIIVSFNFIILTLGYNFFNQTKYLVILIFKTMTEEIKEFIEWIGFSGEVEPCLESGVRVWFIDDTGETMTTEQLYKYYKKINKN